MSGTCSPRAATRAASDRSIAPWQLAARREVEQRNAARMLGAEGVIYFGYPDGFLEDTPDLREKLVRVIRTLKPDIAITWDGYARRFNHRDHRTIGISLLDAIFPLARDHLAFPDLLYEEGLEPHKVGEAWLAGSDEPDYYVDIGDYFHQRAQAAICHVSQVGGREPAAFEKQMRERARELAERAGRASSTRRRSSG